MRKLLICILFLIIFIPGCHFHRYIDGVCKCGEFDEKWLKENFNLDEEKRYFNGSIDAEFTDDCICIVLKNSRTYPILNERHFHLNEAVRIENLFNEPKRRNNCSDEEWENYLNNYHQIVILSVEPKGKEHIIELIKEIEKLPFVLSAEPDYIMHAEDD